MLPLKKLAGKADQPNIVFSEEKTMFHTTVFECACPTGLNYTTHYPNNTVLNRRRFKKEKLFHLLKGIYNTIIIIKTTGLEFSMLT